ncbi:exodeoxyribonuclease VII large subunit [Candidatus Curtissbacteria bacterium]|nr:exodeoxyribonuclease VII large subunit [Candidatus Curtissbacteria bacterium]
MKTIDGKSVYSVSEVNALTRQTLENMSFWVEGEISSFKGLNHHYRYLYFDLKDPNTGYKLPCILEPSIFQSVDFAMADGIKVLALGNLSLYERDGTFQMYIHQLEQFGEGILLAELEKLKKKLEQKGYFDKSRKKPLPSYPTKIAVITSKIADAWFDFKRHSVDRFPVINVTLFDVMVQGSSAVNQIVKAIQKAEKGGFDAIVLVRGGGSLEDLAAFNDEKVAHSIFHAKTTIVVGVGHEKDVTIAQLVADIAASTPTDAAKIITADFLSLEEKLTAYRDLLEKSIARLISSSSQTLDLTFHRLAYHKEKFQQFPRHLDFLKQSLKTAEDRIIVKNSQKLETYLVSIKNTSKYFLQEKSSLLNSLNEKLIILSPLNTLARGYSITTDESNRVIKNSSQVAIGSKLKVQFHRGKVTSKILTKEDQPTSQTYGQGLKLQKGD